MKAATANLVALLANAANGVGFFVEEAANVALANGNTVLLSTTRTASVANAPLFKRGPITTKVGLAAASMSMTLLLDADTLIDGMAAVIFARSGGFDGAGIVCRRNYRQTPGAAIAGNLHLFQGVTSQIDEISASRITMTWVSDIELLNQQMPKRMYQTTCQHDLYDAGCTLDPADFEVPATVANGATIYAIPTDLVANTGTYDLGVIVFTSGALQGLQRTVKTYANGVITPVLPLPVAPQNGDGLVARPGCDKLFATCNGPLFLNGDNFLGWEFIPVPEAGY